MSETNNIDFDTGMERLTWSQFYPPVLAMTHGSVCVEK